jgi:hypothetical protein
MQVLDSDKKRYEVERGYDCLVRLLNPDGTVQKKCLAGVRRRANNSTSTTALRSFTFSSK